MTADQMAQQRQLSVKEMFNTWNDCHGQGLWSGPVHHTGQWHRIVNFAMHDQCFFMHVWRHRCDVEPGGCCSNQNNFVQMRVKSPLRQGMAGDISTKRKTSQSR
mgnify:CR=1 FL=1